MSETGPPSECDGASVGGDDVLVLLVDDNEAWARSTAQVLEHQRAALSVRTATDLSTASAAFAEYDPDCVVCDYQLEAGTGLELLEEVRDRSPDRPFVLITGEGDETVASDAISQEVTDYIPKRSLGGRDDLLASRVESAVDSYRTRRALDRERRTKDAMLDVLTATTGETELSRQFCAQLVERGYACAWIGRVTDGGGPVPRAVAGREAYLDAVVGPDRVPPPGEPARRALDADGVVATSIGEPRDGPAAAVPGDIADRSDGQRGTTPGGMAPERSAHDWETVAADCGFERAVAGPVRSDGVQFGVLAVYADDAVVDADRERSAVSEYADTVGYALRTAEQQRSLLSSHPVSLSVEVGDGAAPLVAVAEALPASSAVEVRSALPRGDGTTLYVAAVEGVPASTLEERVTAVDAVESVTVDADASPPRCEVVVAARTPEELLASHGARFEETVVDDGAATLSVRVSDDAKLATLRETLETEYDDVTVSTVWTGRDASAAGAAGDPLADLTARQRDVLRHAFAVGYFERPRGASATDLADHFDVARATVTQHLRTAQRKVFSHLLSGED